MLRRSLLLLTLLSTAAACSGDSTGPGDTDDLSGTLSFSATGDVEQSYAVSRSYPSRTIDADLSEEHAVAYNVAGAVGGGGLFQDGLGNPDELVFVVTSTSTGTYAPCDYVDDYGYGCVTGIALGIDVNMDTEEAQVRYEMVTGSVTIHEISESRVRGTFEADLSVENTEGEATVFIRNGAFDLPFLNVESTY